MYDDSQPGRRTFLVVPVDLGLVVLRVVAEELAALLEPDVVADQLPLVVVADLVAEVPEHRPVGLAEVLADLLAVGGLALGQVDGDQAVGVPDDDVLLDAAQQVEGQPVLGVHVLADHREAEGVELEDDVPLRPLGRREVGDAAGVLVVGAGAGQAAARSTVRPRPGSARCTRRADRLRHTCHCSPTLSTYDPVGVHRDDGALLAGEAEAGAAGDAHGVLEVERVVTDPAAEGLHLRSLPQRWARSDGRITA